MITKIEFEVLFYPVEKETYRQKLKDLGAQLLHSERKMRRAVIDHRNYPQLQCQFVRIRDEGNGVVRLSAKNHADPGGKIADKKEIDVQVQDFDQIIEIFNLAGLKPLEYKENVREDWQLQDAEISIDTWPGLATHTEIESSSEENVKRIAELLGFDWNKKIITSRIEIYAQLYGKTVHEILDMSARLTFEKNPFSKLPIIGQIDYSIQKG